jgi:hypothetical protein
MSIADNFDRKPEAGFVRAYDIRAARRQFQVSLALVLVLGVAAIALGFLTQLDRPLATGRLRAAAPGNLPVAETLLDIRG